MANGAKKQEPLIKVQRDRSVRRSYGLPASAADQLDEYAEFYTEHTGGREAGRKVSAGDIIAGLVEKLAKDRAFVEWKQKRERASDPVVKPAPAANGKAAGEPTAKSAPATTGSAGKAS